jgi:hypothetical protein
MQTLFLAVRKLSQAVLGSCCRPSILRTACTTSQAFSSVSSAGICVTLLSRAFI